MKRIYILVIVMLAFNMCNAQWQQTSLDTTYIMTLVMKGNDIYAGTYFNGVYVSSNNGYTWVNKSSGLPNNAIWSFIINDSNILAASEGSGMFLSTNNGNNWNTINNGIPSNTMVWASTNNGNNIFIGTNSLGVFLTTNNGANWIHRGLTMPDQENNYIQSLVFKDNKIYAGTGNGVYSSTDNGLNWTYQNNGFPVNYVVYSFIVSGNNIFAGMNGSGVYISTDNGNSWFASGLTSGYIYALAKYDNIIFAGGSSGVFYSTDNGSNWIMMNQGLLNTQVSALLICGKDIYTGTFNGGIWKRSLLELSVLQESSNSNNIYPNPATSNLTLNLQLQTSLQNTIVSIYDVQGKLLLLQTITEPQTELNIASFSKGIYVVKVNNDKNSMVSKFVKE